MVHHQQQFSLAYSAYSALICTKVALNLHFKKSCTSLNMFIFSYEN